MLSDVIERLVEDVRPGEGLVSARVHADPAVYRLELARIFQRVWLYVAHESELREPNDFVRRDMGEQSVIVWRGADGDVRAFLNVCRHRGMRVCLEDAGNGRTLRCPYHGFSYTSDGRLAGVPYQREAYAEGLDKSTMSLASARVESYRGLLFATFDADAEPLVDYLGDMRWYLDIMAGRGEMEIVGAPQRWVVPTGWKLPAENFAADAYHTATTHAFLAKLHLVAGADFGKRGYHVDVGNGHGLGIGIQDDGPWYPPELRAEYARLLTSEQLALLDRVKNFHGNVFPNLSFLIPNVIEVEGHRVSGTTLRQWQPIGPDRVRVWSWYLVERSAPDWWKNLGRATHVQTFGASGMFEQDDTENWEMQTRNASATLERDDVVFNYTMGLHREPLTDFPGPGTVYEGKFSDAAARSFYQRWLDLVTAE